MSLFPPEPGVTPANLHRIGRARAATAAGVAATLLAVVAAVVTGWWGCLLAAVVSVLLTLAALGCWRMWGWVEVTRGRRQWVVASRATAGVAVPSAGAAVVALTVGVTLGQMTWPLAGLVIVSLVLAAALTTWAA